MRADFLYKTTLTLSAAGTGTADVTTQNIVAATGGWGAPGFGKLVAQLVLNAPTGSPTTPTYDAKIQESFDGTNWTDVVAFTQATTSAAAEIKKYVTGPLAPYLRLYQAVGTASGTATYTGTLYLSLCI